MNAIKMLKDQHRQGDKLFKDFEDAESAEARRDAFIAIADELAIHATIEERHFYPSVKEAQTDGILLESVEEHLQIKRVIADLLELDAADVEFQAKVTTLQEDVGH